MPLQAFKYRLLDMLSERKHFALATMKVVM